MMSISERIVRIASIKERFRSLLTSEVIVRSAIEENHWFSSEEIAMAVDAIATEMLSLDKLSPWCKDLQEPARRLNVGVVAAGNLPLVGFLDILAVAVSGHRVLYSLSSKDSVLMRGAIELLSGAIGGEWFTELDDNTQIDAVIATGSSSSERYFKWRYRDIAQVVRGSRSSVALITDHQSESDLLKLWSDIFTYKGQGCRNVSRLLLPTGYPLSRITDVWHKSGFKVESSDYRGSYIQNRALLEMCGSDYFDGGYFTVRQEDNSLQPLSEIRIIRYTTHDEVVQYLSENEQSLQCIVAGDVSLHPRAVPFGRAQQPSLNDWADGVDLFNFLNSLD